MHWDLSGPDPPSSLTSSGSLALAPTPVIPAPRATLSQAHDSNVWALAFHPLGHVLASASNDHTTRFWSRERPGDATSVFSAGGEKPPDMVDTSQQDEEDEGMAVPGFGFGGAQQQQPPQLQQGAWKQEDGGGPNGWRGQGQGYGKAEPEDDFIPGFGDGPGAAVAGRQGGPLPPQQDVYGGGPGGPDDFGRGEGRGGRGGRQSRWGPRRGF